MIKIKNVNTLHSLPLFTFTFMNVLFTGKMKRCSLGESHVSIPYFQIYPNLNVPQCFI